MARAFNVAKLEDICLVHSKKLFGEKIQEKNEMSVEELLKKHRKHFAPLMSKVGSYIKESDRLRDELKNSNQKFITLLQGISAHLESLGASHEETQSYFGLDKISQIPESSTLKAS